MIYLEDNASTFREDDDGIEKLANFTARIIEEVKYIDGSGATNTTFAIEGHTMIDGAEVKLPRITLQAEEFMTMTWPLKQWGVRCVVMPVAGGKDDLRTHILLASTPRTTKIYRHTGWSVDDDGSRMFVHRDGAMKATGNDPRVKVELPSELRRYAFGAPSSRALASLLNLADLLPAEKGWPILLAALSPIYCDCDFGAHVSGRTGTFKSEFMSLAQSLYGREFDARNLPGSWSSTANALEAQAFLAKNVVFVIDDFIPVGSSYQIRAYQAGADRIFRAQGNQSGRARMNDMSSLQRTYYPRGIVLSTGEDIPEGHSCRARMLIVELDPGDIKPDRLTTAQEQRAEYSDAVAYLITRCCNADPEQFLAHAKQLRSEYLGVGHTRTPTMLATLAATAHAFLQACRAAGVINDKAHKVLLARALDALRRCGDQQIRYMVDSDPCEIFLNAVRTALANHTAHIRTLSGGIPRTAERLGWVCDDPMAEFPLYKNRNSPTVGWISWDKDELYLDETAVMSLAKRQTSEVTLSKQTLLKRLRDQGHLTRTDERRQRNTIRITAENHPRTCLCMRASAFFNTQETYEEGE